MSMTAICPLAHRMGKDQFMLLMRSADELPAMQIIEDLLVRQGYKKESVSVAGAVFGRGSKAARILAGGLSSRQEFLLERRSDGEMTMFTLKATSSIFWGGMIAISSMRREIALLGGMILGLFAPCPDSQATPPQMLGPFAPFMTGKAGKGVQFTGLVIALIIIAIIAVIAAVNLLNNFD